MSKGPENHRTSEVLVLGTRRCRKSEAVIRFLKEEQIFTRYSICGLISGHRNSLASYTTITNTCPG